MAEWNPANDVSTFDVFYINDNPVHQIQASTSHKELILGYVQNIKMEMTGIYIMSNHLHYKLDIVLPKHYKEYLTYFAIWKDIF